MRPAWRLGGNWLAGWRAVGAPAPRRVALVGRMAERRFGAGAAARVTALLADETDLSRLDEAGEWLLECDTGEALLARLAGRPPRG